MKLLLRKVPTEVNPNITGPQKIAIAIMNRISSSEFFKTLEERRSQSAFVERAAKEEELKTLLLGKIHTAIGNGTPNEHGVYPSAAVIFIPSFYDSDVINTVIRSKELRPYRIEFPSTAKDIQFLFEKTPVFLRVSHEGGVA